MGKDEGCWLKSSAWREDGRDDEVLKPGEINWQYHVGILLIVGDCVGRKQEKKKHAKTTSESAPRTFKSRHDAALNRLVGPCIEVAGSLAGPRPGCRRGRIRRIHGGCPTQ